MYDAIALGELLIDFACIEKNEDGYPVMAAHPGGAPANFLAAMQKFGSNTAMIGKIGEDTFGNLLINTLKKAGVATEGIVKSDSVFTTLAFVTLNDEGDRSFSFARKPGADTQLSDDELNFSLIENSKVFHFGSLSLTDDPSDSATRCAVAYAKKKNKIVSFDPNLRKPLWNDLDKAKEKILWGLSNADVVKISEEEVEFLFGNISLKAAAELLIKQFGIKLVYITVGKDGCYYSNGIVNGTKGCFDVGPATDTTGAGDIFGGSAMHAYLNLSKRFEELSADDLNHIVSFATIAAGISTTRPGGISSIPDYAEVMDNLNGFLKL